MNEINIRKIFTLLMLLCILMGCNNIKIINKQNNHKNIMENNNDFEKFTEAEELNIGNRKCLFIKDNDIFI